MVLALFDGREESEPRETRLHHFLELPLNHLGYVVEYWDISGGPPPAVLRSDVVAVASWFQGPVGNVAEYEAWAATVRAECSAPRWLVLGDPGTAKYGLDTPERTAFLARLGLAAIGTEQRIGSFAVPLGLDPELIGYESDFVVEPDVYRPLHALPGATSHLAIAPNPEAPDQAIDLFVAGPDGVYLHGSAIATFDRRTGATFWIVDPFRLIAMVLGQAPHPIPDVTTLNGRRLFFATVGAEGWLAVAPALNFGQEPLIAAEILRDKVIVPYGDLPQTVAVLTGDFDISQGERAARTGSIVAEQVFALKQVQVGSNGDSLIRNWDFFEQYDRDTETRQIDEFAARANDKVTGLVNVAVRNLEGAFAAPGSGSDLVPNAPRKYTRAPFDLERETTGAIALTEALAPSGKRVSAYLWTGNAKPFAAALSQVGSAGYPALGGGGGIYNDFAPSVSNLWPFYASVGAAIQVYDGLSGDSAYTGFWRSPIHGFHMLPQTLAATESPRRLKPFHLAYSAQSMIDYGTRSAVLRALDLARSEPIIPITVPEYIAIVNGYRSFRAEPEGENRWRITNRGDLQTVRFDDAADLALDMEASEGVLGARRKDTTLYVALLPAATAPLIALTANPRVATQHDPDRFALVESRLKIGSMEQDACGMALTASGWGAGKLVWEAPAARTYMFRVQETTGEQLVLLEVNVAVGADGRLELALPPLQGETVSVRLEGGC